MVDRLVGMRGISVRPAGATGWVIYQRTPPGSAGSVPRCATLLWVDGVPRPSTILNTLRPEDVEAVEVYDAVEVPLRFGRTNAGGRPSCGAVVMWLKEPKA